MTDDKPGLLECQFCGGEAKKVNRAYCRCLKCRVAMPIDVWNARAPQPQPPVIEGLDEAIIHCASDTVWPNRYCELLLRAARLYAQGQTAQPHGDLVLCRRVIKEPEHEGATGYEYFVPVKEAQPVDLDGFNKLVEMLEREPQHNPRLSALLREDSVFDKQPTEDAQGALQLFNDYFSTDPAVKNDEELQGMVKTIRAALAQPEFEVVDVDSVDGVVDRSAIRYLIEQGYMIIRKKGGL